MKVVTAKEMQKIDKISINDIGIHGEVLMGYAGKSIADYIAANLKGIKAVAVFSGTGNNGGDGFVIGYFLANMGFDVDIYIAGSREKVSETSNVYLNICINNGVPVIETKEKSSLNGIDIDRYDLIIDAMLGTGFEGIPRGIIKDVIEMINDSSAKTLSVDLPSGLPSDGEAPQGETVKADYTITIGLPKISCVTYPGKKYIGKLHVTDIGFPVSLTQSDDLKIDLLNNDYVEKRLNLSRDCDIHKGEMGHLLLVGGFDNMEGAIIMTAQSAFETGVGLSTLLTTKGARQIIAGKIPELITRTQDSLDLAKLDADKNEIKGIEKKIENGLREFFNEGRKYDAIIIGPGMGRTSISSKLFNLLIANLEIFGINRVLIDGDGLYHLSEFLKDNKLPEKVSFIITPHFYEASRLLNKSVDQIKANRIGAAIELSQKTGAVALLKGPSTISSDGNASLINTTGNPALSTAGSGDVLSGIIGALLLRNISPLDAAGIGSYIHGLTADICITENETQILKATDIIEKIRKAILQSNQNIS